MSSKIHPTWEEFLQLSRRGNVIPVYQEILADFETPLSAYLQLDGAGPSYLLESVEQGERLGRFSFLGSNPSMILESNGRRMKLKTPRESRTWITLSDPISEMERLMSGYKSVPVPGLPRFCGGFVGYAGYNLVRFLEPVGSQKQDPLHLPDSVWLFSDTLVIFDHIEHVMKVVANAFIPSGFRGGQRRRARMAYLHATGQIETMAKKLRRGLPAPPPRRGRPMKMAAIRSNMSRSAFTAAVSRAKRAIGRGEIIQVVLSQRFRVPVVSHPFEIYRALRSVNPSPYMFYLNLGGFALVGSSPEILVRCEEGNVEVRPIAGTRPRGKSPAMDRQIEEGLKKDPKERAEHLMLADLGRNDIGRVCEYGSVQVSDLMTVERYSHVMHLVSSVTGKLKKGLNAFDLLRAAFPAGTVTGAPKVRAMQIINELEPDSRGPYAGAVGYLSFNGNLDTCITIRTVLVKGKEAFVQAGAGIVAGSRPEREYQETKNKAAGMLRAIELAEQGLG